MVFCTFVPCLGLNPAHTHPDLVIDCDQLKTAPLQYLVTHTCVGPLSDPGLDVVLGLRRRREQRGGGLAAGQRPRPALVVVVARGRPAPDRLHLAQEGHRLAPLGLGRLEEEEGRRENACAQEALRRKLGDNY